MHPSQRRTYLMPQTKTSCMLSCLTQNPDRIFILCIDVSSITNKSTEKKVLEICVNYYVPECKTL